MPDLARATFSQLPAARAIPIAQPLGLFVGLLLGVQALPVGEQSLLSAPAAQRIQLTHQAPNLLLSTLGAVPPVGDQSPLTAQAPRYLQPSAPSPNLLLSTLAQATPPEVRVPPFHGPTQVIAVRASNSTIPPDLLPPTAAAALPIGDAALGSAPYSFNRLTVYQPANLLGGPLGLPPIASSQSEFMPQLRASQVFSWLAPNATVALASIPGQIPPGQQWTDSAPILRYAVQSFTAPVIVPPVITPIPIGKQQSESIPRSEARSQAVYVWLAPNTIFRLPAAPIPVGSQQTASAPVLNPVVQNYEAPNATLFEVEAPTPPPAPPAAQKQGHGRNYIIKGRKYYNLTNEELVYLIARELIDPAREDIRVTYKNKKPHRIPMALWNEVGIALKNLESIQPEDDDDEAIALLL